MPGNGRTRIVAALVTRIAPVVALGVALAVAAVVLVATGRLPGLGGPGPTPTAAAPLTVGHGPKPPGGVWMGAWVKPNGPETPQGLVSAYRNYERSIGHRMAIVHLYFPWTSALPKAAATTFLNQGRQVLVSWGGADTEQIAAGRYDDLIRARAHQIKQLGKPVLLMWRGEMDRPNLRAQIHSPADYIAAWTHIRTIFAASGADNVGWVWCPIAQGFDAGRAPTYYPGDAQVDWLCTDAYPDTTDPAPFTQVTAAFLKWAKAHPKPIVIGEYGADAGDRRAQLAWLRGAWHAITTTPAIKAATYFDANVPTAHTPYRYSLRQNRAALAAFGRALASPRVTPPSKG